MGIRTHIKYQYLQTVILMRKKEKYHPWQPLQSQTKTKKITIKFLPKLQEWTYPKRGRVSTNKTLKQWGGGGWKAQPEDGKTSLPTDWQNYYYENGYVALKGLQIIMIPNQNSNGNLLRKRKSILKFIWKHTGHRTQAMLSKKNNAEIILMPDLKLYHRATMTKSA